MSAAAAPRIVQVDVWFDLICPWCWIGKHYLDQARARLAESDPDLAVQVRWHSVQLIPDVPLEGWPRAAFYERRLGSPEAVRARQAQVLEAAQQAGAPIDFSRMSIFPNSARAHQLLAQARSQLPAEGFEAVLHRLLEGYFVRGEDLGSAPVLAAIAAEHGVNQSLVAQGLFGSSPGGGVPLFAFNQRFALSGAQPADSLWAAMRESVL
ncbi:DsbA family oxidoreductase [Comamonas humi]